MKYEIQKNQRRIIQYQYILIFMLLFAFVQNSSAAPSIQSVTGNITNGGQITVNSANNDFGANGPVVQFFDDSENGVIGANLTTSYNPVIGSYSATTNYSCNPKFSEDYSLGGNGKSLRQIYDSTNSCSFMSPLTGSDIINGFISFWVYIPTDSIWGGGAGSEAAASCTESMNWKFLQFDAADYQDWGYITGTILGEADSSTNVVSSGYYSGGVCSLDYYNIDWKGNAYDPCGRPAYGAPPPASKIANFTKGEWKRIWSYIHGHETAGSVTEWDIEPSGANAGIARRNIVTSGVTRPPGNPIFSYINWVYAPRCNSTAVAYMDDFYAATGPGAQARIEIGNNENYDDCTNLTLATPTSWSSSSIAATVRRGSFQNGSAYLFVIDADGNVSNGYPITIGGTPDTTAPASPSGLSVS